jgi:hypothetical protein
MVCSGDLVAVFHCRKTGLRERISTTEFLFDQESSFSQSLKCNPVFPDVGAIEAQHLAGRDQELSVNPKYPSF